MNQNTISEDRKSLEVFILNNRELELLETLLRQFNIFEAIGVVRQELRHSDFLAFLLDPKQNHGLGDTFLKRLLMHALQDFEKAPLSLIDIEVNNLAEATVSREWQNIDICIIDEKTQLVVVIENKIDTGEHDDQLSRYRTIVHHKYPNYRQIFIFLTPDELLPASEENRLIYIPLSYRSVAQVIDQILEIRGLALNSDVFILLKHYSIMLRRHIVSDSEIAELCRKIYQTHKRALDLIFEHMPNLQHEIVNYCIDLVNSNSALIHEPKIKRAISFGLTKWDRLSPLMSQGEKWGDSSRLLRFWLSCDSSGLYLNLYLWPSDLHFVRQYIFEVVQQNIPPFSTHSKIKMFDKWQYIYQHNTLTNGEIETANSLDDVKSQIDEFWQQFLYHDLPAISEILETKIDWVYLEQQANELL